MCKGGMRMSESPARNSHDCRHAGPLLCMLHATCISLNQTLMHATLQRVISIAAWAGLATAAARTRCAA